MPFVIFRMSTMQWRVHKHPSLDTNGVFGLRSEVVHLLTPCFLYLVRGMELGDPSSLHSSQANNYYIHEE